jgi:VanZ family protein
MLQRKSLKLSIAVLYLVLISILFCLPGAALPKVNWLSKIWFDKWMHIGFFALLVVVWSWAVNSTQKKMVATVLIAAAVYGISVEIVQDQFIANRSFDTGDWIADIFGSFIGLWFWDRYIKK